MKKIISFSLWGDKPIYTVGAIANAVLAQEIYPGWICRFYIHRSSIPQNIIRELEKQPNVELVDMPEDIGWSAMLWRFYPATEEDVSVMLSRDCDSRLSQREKACVDYWLNKTDRKVMTIRDTCVHQSQMMGGLWGVRDRFLINIKPFLDKLIEETKQKSLKGVDQDFLNSKIYLYAVGEINEQGRALNKLSGFDPAQISIISHDDIAFGCVRFPKFTRLPHVNDEMRQMPIPRKYGNEYKVCPSCGLRHDSEFIGRDECLTDEECKYINLTPEQIEERNNIVKYYKLYQKDRDILGLTTIYE